MTVYTSSQRVPDERASSTLLRVVTFDVSFKLKVWSEGMLIFNLFLHPEPKTYHIIKTKHYNINNQLDATMTDY